MMASVGVVLAVCGLSDGGLVSLWSLARDSISMSGLELLDSSKSSISDKSPDRVNWKFRSYTAELNVLDFM